MAESSRSRVVPLAGQRNSDGIDGSMGRWTRLRGVEFRGHGVWGSRGSALQRFIDGPSRIDDVDLGDLLVCLFNLSFQGPVIAAYKVVPSFVR